MAIKHGRSACAKVLLARGCGQLVWRDGTPFIAASEEALAPVLPRVGVLELGPRPPDAEASNTAVTDSDVEAMVREHPAHRIDLRNCTALSAAALVSIATHATQLRVLDVRGCRGITRLPLELSRLEHLVEVLVTPAGMVFPVPEVCAVGGVAVVRFLRDAAAGGLLVPCNVAKLVVAGGPFEGKSSLVDLLGAGTSTHPGRVSFPLPGRKVAARTIGLDIVRLTVGTGLGAAAAHGDGGSQAVGTNLDFVVCVARAGLVLRGEKVGA